MAKLQVISVFMLIFVISGSRTDSSPTKCVQQNPCSCRLDDFHKIDISSAIEAKDEFLEDTHRKSNLTYFFHGCTDAEFDAEKILNIKNTTGKFSASLVLVNITGNLTEITTLGVSKNISFAEVDNSYQIVYRSGPNVTASVRLICDNFNTPFIKVISAVGNVLAFSSPKVCVITEEPPISNFSIFLLLFCSGIFLYLVGGAATMYFVRGARGMEIIPNVDFWRKLPRRLQYGTIYILSGCRPNVITTEETYDRI